MAFSDWIRRTGFWGLDFLRGSKVRKHYMDIKNILENNSDQDVSKKKQDNLNNILKYAAENVEFYKGFKDYHSLDSFPVINKNIIRDNYVALQSSKFQRGKVTSMHTSGSTGTPFVVRQDKNKRNRVYAEMIYFWGRAGYQIGLKYAFLRIRNPFSRLDAWSRNVLVLGIGKQDEEVFENIRRKLKSDRKIKMILGYAGTLDNLANHLFACGDSPEMFNIHTIIGFGEAFPENAHKKIREMFNCNVVSLYSNQENGMIAQECVENKEFHVNGASYFIELLDLKSDNPVGIGESGRIVVTDLFNQAMPMIRYDTGDIGIWKKEPECAWHTQVLSCINGQKTDGIFDTKGNEKSPHTISVLLEPFEELLQYQFIQESAKQYTLKLNLSEKHYDDATFINILKDFLGEDAEIIIEHVKEIPVLSSGKRKEVVNNYRKVKVKQECVG